jgi:hypothetical protein
MTFSPMMSLVRKTYYTARPVAWQESGDMRRENFFPVLAQVVYLVAFGYRHFD